MKLKHILPAIALSVINPPALAQEYDPVTIEKCNETQDDTRSEVQEILEFEAQCKALIEELNAAAQDLQSDPEKPEKQRNILDILSRFFSFLLLDVSFGAILAVDAAILSYLIFNRRELSDEEVRKIMYAMTLSHVVWAGLFGGVYAAGEGISASGLFPENISESLQKTLAVLAGVIAIGFSATIITNENEREDDEADKEQNQLIDKIVMVMSQKPVLSGAAIGITSHVAVDAGFGAGPKIEEMQAQGMNWMEIGLHAGVSFIALAAIMRLVGSSYIHREKLNFVTDHFKRVLPNVDPKVMMLVAAAFIGYLGFRQLSEQLFDNQSREILKFAIIPLVGSAGFTALLNEFLKISDPLQEFMEERVAGPFEAVADKLAGDIDDQNLEVSNKLIESEEEEEETPSGVITKIKNSVGWVVAGVSAGIVGWAMISGPPKATTLSLQPEVDNTASIASETIVPSPAEELPAPVAQPEGVEEVVVETTPPTPAMISPVITSKPATTFPIERNTPGLPFTQTIGHKALAAGYTSQQVWTATAKLKKLGGCPDHVVPGDLGSFSTDANGELLINIDRSKSGSTCPA